MSALRPRHHKPARGASLGLLQRDHVKVTQNALLCLGHLSRKRVFEVVRTADMVDNVRR